MRVCAENGTNVAPGSLRARGRAGRSCSLASTTIERPSGVSSARLASWAALGQVLDAHARRGQELGGHAVAERDGAGLVEQQRVDVARRLDRAAAHRDDVVADQAVHAGDADGGEQAADRGRDQADEQRHDHRRPRSAGRSRAPNGTSVTQAIRKMIVSPTSRTCRAISFGRLLPLGALDEADHAVEERLAGVGGDADHDAVGEHLGAAGDRRAVAAALADDRGRLAGDGRLVHRGDALDHLAVAGDRARRPRPPPRRPCAASEAATALLAPVDELAGPSSPCAARAAPPPGPCRGPRPAPRRSWRRAR